MSYPLDGDLAAVGRAGPVSAALEDGTPQFVAGRVGAAATFDGKRFINAGTSPNLGYDDAFTLAAWMYPTAPDGAIVSRTTDGDQGEVGWGLYLAGGKVRMSLSTRDLDDGVSVETVDALPLNEWRHVVATYDGSKAPGGFRLYVNGRAQAITPLVDAVGNRLPQSGPLRIGASGSLKRRFHRLTRRPLAHVAYRHIDGRATRRCERHDDVGTRRLGGPSRRPVRHRQDALLRVQGGTQRRRHGGDQQDTADAQVPPIKNHTSLRTA